MHCICSKSGLPFTVQHFPFSLTSGEIHHPVFDIPTKKLLGLAGKWNAHTGAFTPEDTRLYFLALLNSTELIEWRTFAKPALSTCEQNLAALIRVVGWIDFVTAPSVHLPRFVISPETATLENVFYWIQSWEKAKQEFDDGYRTFDHEQKLIRREASLTRLLRLHSSNPEKYSIQLAEWASLAGNFPDFAVKVGAYTKPISEYWKQIIITAIATPKQIWRIDIADIDELIEHLEENLHHGNIFAHTVLKVLRTAKEKYRDYLGMDISLDSSMYETGNYRILADTTNVETANMMALISNAPTTKPERVDYPNAASYLKAKVAWEMAQRYQGQLAPQSSQSGEQ